MWNRLKRWIKNNIPLKKTKQVCEEYTDGNCDLINRLRLSQDKEKAMQVRASEIISSIGIGNLPYNVKKQIKGLRNFISNGQYMNAVYNNDEALIWRMANTFLDRGDLEATISVLCYIKTQLKEYYELEEKISNERKLQRQLKEQLGIN